MKIHLDTSINTVFLKEVIGFVKDLELKEGSLSQATFKSHSGTRKQVYSIWHNKKSFTILHSEIEV